MRAALAIIGLLAGCAAGPSSDELRLDVPDVRDPLLPFVDARPAPPPPPPPPVGPFPRPPPRAIAHFLASESAAPVVVTLHALVYAGHRRIPARARFLGYRSARHVVLPAAASAELVAALGRDTSYDENGALCMAEAGLGVRLQRGAETLDLICNCGYIILTEDWKQADLVSFSESMTTRLDELADAARLWRR